jgi:hypothetical protein
MPWGTIYSTSMCSATPADRRRNEQFLDVIDNDIRRGTVIRTANEDAIVVATD